MKSRIFLLFIFINCALSVLATHNRAGIITFRYVSSLTYQATITTFTKASSVQADRDTLNLDWGDGTIEKVLRSNGNGTGEILPGGSDLKLNIYISSVHTYATPCTYIVSITDPNRISNIININAGASVNVPFYIEAFLVAETGVCLNSAPILLSVPIMFAKLNDLFLFTPTFMDPDGDSLYFELVPPLMDHNLPVPNYQYPNEIDSGVNNSFFINDLSGEISWFTPQRVGTYNVAIRVSEYKNGMFYGYTIFDHQIIVLDDTLNSPSFATNWQTDANGNYSFTVNPGDTLQLDFTATADSLGAVGEPLMLSQPASFSQNGSAPSLNGSFFWIPDSSQSRLYPYIITFRASSPLQRDLTALIYVTGGSRSGCNQQAPCTTTGGARLSSQSILAISPNPFSSSCRITVNENFTAGNNLTLRLFDSVGKHLRSLQSSSGEFILQRGTLEDGLYLFEIYDATGANRRAGKVILRSE